MKPKLNNHHQNPGKEKCVNVIEKTSANKLKQTSIVSSAAQLKPFAGKVFYLDLPSNRAADALERDIKKLGGTVEKFFCKEIKYLVSNKREAKHAHRLRQDSPVPSPDSGQSSLHPRSNPHHLESVKSKSQAQLDSLVKSRGKSLVERVVTGQGMLQMDRILANALEWGVKILYLDDVLAYIQKKKKVFGISLSATAPVKSHVKPESLAKLGCQKWKVGRITKPFIKIEDSSRHYRPVYLTMPNVPEFNLTTAAPHSPFCAEDKNPPMIKQHGHRGVKASGAEEKGHGRKKHREKKRGGYCECCMVKYDQLKMHLQSERHKAFSTSDEYLVLDQQVSTLHLNFLPITTKTTRPKCSVSSDLLVPGTCGEADASLQMDVGHSEIVKAEENQTVNASEGSYSGYFCGKGDRSASNTYSDKSKRKLPARKRTIKQNSSPQKSEHIMTPQPMSGNPHSDREFLASLPPRDKNPHKDTNGTVSNLQGTHLWSEAAASNFSVAAQDAKEEAPPSEVKTFSETENNLAVDGEESPRTPLFSAVQSIHRKIKVYKHKRRKVEANADSAEQEPHNSLLNFWEIFQSSDDMDGEFLGFSEL